MVQATPATPLGKPIYPLGAWVITNPDRISPKGEGEEEPLWAPLKQIQAKEQEAGWKGDWKADPLQNSWVSLEKDPHGCSGKWS